MVTEAGYVCATSIRFEVRREGSKWHVGSESMSSIRSSAFFSRMRAQLRLFLPCFS